MESENPLDSKVNLIGKLGTKINIIIDQDAKRAISQVSPQHLSFNESKKSLQEIRTTNFHKIHLSNKKKDSQFLRNTQVTPFKDIQLDEACLKKSSLFTPKQK